MTFSTLGLSAPILKAIAEQGYDTPSPIQTEAIPAVLAGDDVMAAAQTGTGKTAGFTLPILQKLINGPKVKANHIRVLILTPTRELAAQVAASVETYSKHLPITSTVVFGGVKINPQMIKMRKGVDVLVATPGRLLDLYNQNAVKFNTVEVLVLDEADRMLDMGFMPDIRRILAQLPKKRQNLMFSATFSAPIRSLAKSIVHQAVEISVAPPNATATAVKQWVCPVDKKRKPALLAKLIRSNDWGQVLVFTRTKHGANRLTRDLESKGIIATAIHGNKSQGARTRALAEFKQGEVQVLVATDIAARGLDIHQLPHVVNFDLPNVAADYVHRIGRTGRAGADGEAVSLVCADEFAELVEIERLTQTVLARETIEGFEPVHALPESRLDMRPPRKKKPKKTRNTQSEREGSANKKARRKAASSRAGKPSSHNTNSNTNNSANSKTNNKTNNNNNSSKAKAKTANNNSERDGQVKKKRPARRRKSFNGYGQSAGSGTANK